MAEKITQHDIWGTDFLAIALFRHGRTPWQMAGLVFLAGFLFVTLISYLFGVFSPRDGLVSSSLDRFNQVNFFFIFPAVAYYYAWQTRGILGVYHAVLSLLPAERQEYASDAIRKLHRRWLLWLPGLLAGLITVGLGILDNLEKIDVFWYAANGVSIAIMQLARFFALYVIVNSIMRHLAMSASLNRLFEELTLPVSIAQTPYTRAFDAITAQSLSFVVLAAVAGLNLGLQPVLSKIEMPEYAFFLILYFLLVPAGFFLPFLQARSKIVAAKKKVRVDLENRLQAEYELLLRIQSRPEDQPQAELALGRLKTLQETISITDQAPNWPFSLVSVYRLGATVILPFAFAIFNLVMEFRDFVGSLIEK